MAATVRLATRLDVPLINTLVHELAAMDGVASGCKSTDAALDELLFTHPPFHGPTVFMLEVDDESMSGIVVRKPMPETAGNEAPGKTSEGGVLESPASVGTPNLDVELMLFRSISNVKYKGRFFSEVSSPKSSEVGRSHLEASTETDMEEPVLEVFRSGSEVNLKERDASVSTIAASQEPLREDSRSEALEVIGEISVGGLVEDPECEAFMSPRGDGRASRIVVGFIHVYPNYSTYLAKPGLYIEALYIRKPYRKLGLGRMLLKKLAKEAVKLGMERMEWCVHHSNDPAITFYQGMGARIKPGFRRCAIDGQALDNCEL